MPILIYAGLGGGLQGMTEKTGMMVNFPIKDDPEINAIACINQVLNHLLPEDKHKEARKRVVMYVVKRETQGELR